MTSKNVTNAPCKPSCACTDCKCGSHCRCGN